MNRNHQDKDFAHLPVYKSTEAAAALTEKLKNLWDTDLQERPVTSNPKKIFRVEIAVKNLDLLEWLGMQENDTRIYFSGRDPEDLETAGIGIADCVVQKDAWNYPAVFQHIQEVLSPEEPDLKYYGGFSFNPGKPDHDWHAFGAGQWVIPRFQLSRVPGNEVAILSCHVMKEKDSLEDVLGQLERVIFTGKPRFQAPGKPLSRSDLPNYDSWKTNIEREVGNIKAGVYQKTVLARKVELQFQEKPDPVSLLFYLKQLPNMRYDFLFQFQSCCAFVGSSPERLYKRNGRQLMSEAVAGSRSRGSLEQDDQKLAEELLQSDKERREHDFVIQRIIEVLDPLCLSMDVEQDKGLLKLTEGQHLITHLKGILKDDINDDRLIEVLHPTPAVGGCPLELALEAIERSEPFQRGWYAGVVGTVGYGQTDFAVALRSGRTHDHCLSLYSGVGVVEGSIPEMEWQEVEFKIINFMKILENK